MRVVLVDDSAIVRTILAALLSPLEGIAVVGRAADAATGRALIQQFQADVLVLDIGLPDESGIDLLREVRRKHPSLVILMFSLDSDPHTRRACAEAGADGFFDKSQGSHELVEALQKRAVAFALGREQRSDQTDTPTEDTPS